MKEIKDFLNRLLVNNNREWFNAHKDEYRYVQEKFNRFSLELMARTAQFDESVVGLQLKDCTYRIYRDIRFSLDKSPYKTHFGCFICPGGKKSGNAGYYFHVEAEESEYLGHDMLACGIYNPTPAFIKTIREEIDINGKTFDKAVKKAKNFIIDPADMYARVPNGYSKDHPYAEYLRMKIFCLTSLLPKDILYGPDLMDYVVEQFRSTKEFNDLLNKVQDFCR